MAERVVWLPVWSMLCGPVGVIWKRNTEGKYCRRGSEGRQESRGQRYQVAVYRACRHCHHILFWLMASVTRNWYRRPHTTSNDIRYRLNLAPPLARHSRCSPPTTPVLWRGQSEQQPNSQSWTEAQINWTFVMSYWSWQLFVCPFSPLICSSTWTLLYLVCAAARIIDRTYTARSIIQPELEPKKNNLKLFVWLLSVDYGLIRAGDF